jgi:peroxiredoxin
MSLVGKPAPATNLCGPDRKPFSLESLRGSKVVVAFFPGAFTGTCEKEMCTLRDAMSELNGLNAKVIGISVDSPFANAGFAAKNGLQFPLYSDFSRDTVKSWGVVWNNLAGLQGYDVANRAVFLLDEQGNVTWEWIAENPGKEPDYAAIKAALA